MYSVLAVVLIIALIVVTLRLLREPVLRGDVLKKLRPLYLGFFPPPGLYDRIKMGSFDLSQPGMLEFEYAPTYVGEYQIGLLVDRKIEMPKDTYDFGMSAKITTQSRRGPHWACDVGRNPMPWWGTNSNGFTLAIFNAPEDIPLRETSRFRFEVSKGSPSFAYEYGIATVYIAKRPEK